MSITILRPLISLWLAHFLVDFMIGIWAIYKTIAHVDLFMAGLISGAGAFFGEGMQIFFGPLSDRGWRKQLICLGVLVAGAAAFYSYFTDYWMLLIFFIATCMGSAAFHPAAVSLAGALTPHRKSLMITIFSSGGALGLAGSQMIYSHFHTEFDGHTGIFILPLAILAIGLAVYGLKNIQQFSPPKTVHHSVKALFNLFKVRNLRLLYIAQVCNQTIFWATIFFLPDALSCKGYDSWLCHGGGHLFLILGGAAMMIPTGYLSDRYSPKSVILIASVGAMLVFYAFLLQPQFDNSTLMTIMFILGALMAAISPVLTAFGNRLVPESPGMVSAFLMGLAWCVSEGLGQGGGGLISKFFDEHAPVYALMILGVFFIVGVIATLFLPNLDSTEKPVEAL